MPILTPDDHAFFQENGYLVVPNVVPKENCDAVIEVIWAFLGLDRTNPEDWYHEPLTPGGMVELYQHQALWDNRQHPKLYQVFVELLGTETLWVSLDRVNMKPPAHPAHPEYDFALRIHWDADSTVTPFPFGVQGLVFLADTEMDQGGFCCVPEIYRHFDDWVKTQPPDRDPRIPALSGAEEIVSVAGKTGDLLIWNRLLPHGNGHNRSNRPRFAQFITMYPASEHDEAARQERIACWRDRTHLPNRTYFPGDPRHWEQQHSQAAELTPLGRKLLGLDLWGETPSINAPPDPFLANARS